MKWLLFLLLLLHSIHVLSQTSDRPRDHGIIIGVLPPGKYNAITDVPEVQIGHSTLNNGDSINTGVTAIIPHKGNLFQNKVPAAVYVGNGFGKMAGISQVNELGNIETPIILTNTLSVPIASQALIKYTLALNQNKNVRSVNPVVGETNDGYLNDIRNFHVREQDIFDAINSAETGMIKEGNVGAGTGTICFGYKGGIGTASRKLPASMGGYTIGVLIQANFGGVLEINGVPVGKELGRYSFKEQIQNSDGSCMIIVATNAPLSSRNLNRLAKRGIMGLARTGSIASNGSGDYVITFSTHPDVRVPYKSNEPVRHIPDLHNDFMSPLFMACIEATEEAIINALFAAESMKGYNGHYIEALPFPEVLEIMRKYNKIR